MCTPIKNGRPVLASLQIQLFHYLLDFTTTSAYSRTDVLQLPTPYTAPLIVFLKWIILTGTSIKEEKEVEKQKEEGATIHLNSYPSPAIAASFCHPFSKIHTHTKTPIQAISKSSLSPTPLETTPVTLWPLSLN